MSKVVHFLVLIYYVCVDYHIFTYALPRVMDNVKPIYDNRFLMPQQMCTFWLQVAQQVYFLLCFIDDVLDFRIEAKLNITPFRRKLRDFTSYLFATLIFPFSVVISLNFWLILWYEHTYIDAHEVLFEFISHEINHILHTGVVVLVFLEIFTNHTQYPQRILPPFRTISWWVVAYVGTIVILQPYTSIWVYPFIEVWNRNELIAYVFGNFVCLFVAYMTGYIINNYLWRNEDTFRLKKL